MRIKCAVNMGIPETAILLQPWVTTPPLCLGGVPLGLSMEVRKPEPFDPWELMAKDDVHSTIFAVTGQKKHGKSTTMKHMAALLRNLQAGSVNGVPQRMRVRFHDRKRDAADPEYGPITTELGGEIFQLNQSGRINIFDPTMGMSQLDLIDVAANTVETVRRMPFVGHQMLALQIAVWRMHTKARGISCPEALEVILRSLDLDDCAAYFDASNNDVRKMFDEYAMRQEVSEKALGYLDLCMGKPANLNASDLQHDAMIVSEAFGRLLRGDFGRVIGGTRSLQEVLSADVADIVWTGVPDKAITLIEAMFWKWQDVALNNDNTTIIPHIEIGDEEHEAFSNTMHVRFYSAYIAKARQLHTARFICTQQITDFTMAGDPDSEIRRLSEKIVRGIGGHFIGLMPDDDETRHRLSRLGISDYDIEFLCTMIPKGCFGVKLPNRPIKFIQITPSSRVLQLADTNTATRRMTNRIPWMSLDEIRKRAKAAGLLDTVSVG
jgi:energy-coupling factor transporter ATP-binding protein EcfA2